MDSNNCNYLDDGGGFWIGRMCQNKVENLAQGIFISGRASYCRLDRRFRLGMHNLHWSTGPNQRPFQRIFWNMGNLLFVIDNIWDVVTGNRRCSKAPSFLLENVHRKFYCERIGKVISSIRLWFWIDTRGDIVEPVICNPFDT